MRGSPAARCAAARRSSSSSSASPSGEAGAGNPPPAGDAPPAAAVAAGEKYGGGATLIGEGGTAPRAQIHVLFRQGRGGKNHPCGGHGRANGAGGETDPDRLHGPGQQPGRRLRTPHRAPGDGDRAEPVRARDRSGYRHEGVRGAGAGALARRASSGRHEGSRGTVPERLHRRDRLVRPVHRFPRGHGVRPRGLRHRAHGSHASPARASRGLVPPYRGSRAGQRPDVHRAGRLPAGRQGEIRPRHRRAPGPRGDGVHAGLPSGADLRGRAAPGPGRAADARDRKFPDRGERGDPGRGGGAVRESVVFPAGAGPPSFRDDRPALHRGAPPGRGSEGSFRPGAVRRHRLRRKGRFPPRRFHGNPPLHGVFPSACP